MHLRSILKKQKPLKVSGITIACKSGGYLAFYEHRSDIIAQGSSMQEAKSNLRIMYEIILKEDKVPPADIPLKLPQDFKKRYFTDTLTGY